MKVLLIYVWFVNGPLAPEVTVQPWPSNFTYEQCKQIAEAVTTALTKANIYCHIQQPFESTESIATFYRQFRRSQQVPI